MTNYPIFELRPFSLAYHFRTTLPCGFGIYALRDCTFARTHGSSIIFAAPPDVSSVLPHNGGLPLLDLTVGERSTHSGTRDKGIPQAYSSHSKSACQHDLRFGGFQRRIRGQISHAALLAANDREQVPSAHRTHTQGDALAGRKKGQPSRRPSLSTSMLSFSNFGLYHVPS